MVKFMNIIKNEQRLCTCCMEVHEVKMVVVTERTTFKNVVVEYDAFYSYCDKAEELYMDEQQMEENDIRLKDAYRSQEGLLTVAEIEAIRAKYGITQSDFCVLLGWGGKTITRYEGHQVQDRAHDTILKKIDKDSEWFISLLVESRDNLTQEAYQRYMQIATTLYENEQDVYLRKYIEASYMKYYDNPMLYGNTRLSLNKVVEMICYYASSQQVTNLYKVKLMKLLWYADALSYKRRGVSISGLVYQAMPMGAVPIGHNSIINLKGVPCTEVENGEMNSYYFHMDESQEFSCLSFEDIEILDVVIQKLGNKTKRQLVDFMHKEQAYKETLPREVIDFKYAKNLQI